MEIRLSGGLKMETELPILHVLNFRFQWKPDCHALLKLEGYVDKNIDWVSEESYNYHIRIWTDDGGKQQILYHGRLVGVEIINTGGTIYISMQALTASCLLDMKKASRSFQNTTETYGEAVREVFQAEGGQVIRNRESDSEMKITVIRNGETAWQFAKRMGRRTGNYLIPDIETGRPNAWFGMRKGNEIPAFSEEQCTLWVSPADTGGKLRIRTEGRDFYKIGDRTTYLGKKMTIVEVEGIYERGEMVYSYVLEDRTIRIPNFQNESHPAGQGFWGVIKEIEGECVRIALDIDGGKETGNCFYPWYPETGNALYAMPEIGARALLYFQNEGELDGVVIHCLTTNPEYEHRYADRALNTEDGNSVKLTEGNLEVFEDEGHTLSVSDSSILIKSLKNLRICAQGEVRFTAKQITVNTPRELNLCQGS